MNNGYALTQTEASDIWKLIILFYLNESHLHGVSSLFQADILSTFLDIF